jgi:NAD(P)-dependent dehydrogenase (short-subunit alcohol dehydrogenase family)
MVARGGGGKIVFISSVHARIPYVRSVAYNAAKAGLNHMAFTIAAELCPHRINVNIIEPGWIDTPGEHETFGDEVMAQAGATPPWGRLGTPEDIGKAAAFLASEDADYITGTALITGPVIPPGSGASSTVRPVDAGAVMAVRDHAIGRGDRTAEAIDSHHGDDDLTVSMMDLASSAESFAAPNERPPEPAGLAK